MPACRRPWLRLGFFARINMLAVVLYVDNSQHKRGVAGISANETGPENRGPPLDVDVPGCLATGNRCLDDFRATAGSDRANTLFFDLNNLGGLNSQQAALVDRDIFFDCDALCSQQGQ